eukprot:comp23308_c0_seq2/m.38299 comp23308_c0_seq2/g.38299  ORF comp23308_c0_seq2/g.38299 comp23308_c0_seq2/m.38299 type:complete len:423 (-) comp23308_c0_seq2:836-2104(-)
MKRRADSEESDVGSEGEERQSERPAKKAHVDKLEDGVANGVEGENSEPGRDENEGRDNGMDQEDGEGLHSMKTEDGNENSENARVEVEKVGAVGNENEHVPGAVKVEPDSQTLWIGNIPQTWNSEKLKNYVSHFGEVFSVVTKKGYGFVQFVRRQDAEKCKTELHNKQSLVPNRRVIVNMARNEDEAGCQLQLKNVGTATEDTLKALLGKYGRVMSLSINRAHGRNTATAIMDSRRDTEIASVSLDKRMILEGSTQPLRVFPTVPINPTPPPRFQGHTHPFAMQQPYRPFFMPVLDRSGNGLTYPPPFGGFANRPPAPRPILPPVANAGGTDVAGPKGANIYASNMPHNVTPGVLYNMFAQYGKVLSAAFIPGPPTAQRMAYVSYETPEAAQATVRALDKTMVGPCHIRVQLRVPQPGTFNA